MSVIAKDPKTKQCVLMTKGADSVIFPLLSSNPISLATTLNRFAAEGLRTLVMAQRVLSDREFSDWHASWKKFLLSNDPQKDKKLDELGASIEKNLELVGCSAIEDKLQEGVPATIELLMNANIRIWVLTGDKEETAIEIGKSCNLIQSNMELIKLSCNSCSEITDKLEKYNMLFSLQFKSFIDLENTKKQKTQKTAIVIDGITLT